MDFSDRLGGDGGTFQTSAIDPLLDRDMRVCLQLEIALLDVLAVVAL